MWQPREPPLIVVDDSFVLDRWRPADGPALRRFDLDPDTARFFGYSVEQAAAMPDSHYDGDTRARGTSGPGAREDSSTSRSGEARMARPSAGSNSNGPASRLRSLTTSPPNCADKASHPVRSALLAWAASQIGLRRAHLACHVDNAASRRVAEKCGFALVSQDGDEYKLERDLDLPDGPPRPLSTQRNPK